MAVLDVRLDRSLHDPPLAHAELVALTLLIKGFHRAVENVVAQRLVIGAVLAGAGGFQDFDIEPLVPEEALVAGDEQGQVVDGVHHRRRDFFQLRAFLLRGAHAQTPIGLSQQYSDRQTSVNIVRRLPMRPVPRRKGDRPAVSERNFRFSSKPLVLAGRARAPGDRRGRLR